MELRRIAYVLNTFPKVSETFIANELAELARRGVELRMLSLRPPVDELRHGVVERAGLMRWVSYDVAGFAAELERFRPQLIHAHFARQATAKARTLATALGVPYSFTAHRYDIYSRPPEDFHERAMAAGAVITVAEANADYISSNFGVPRERIDIIPCGVDTERFTPGGEKLEPPHLVCVARLEPVKNHAVLLQACALLRSRGVPFRCVLLGDGSAQAQVEAERARLGLDDLVLMPGAAEQDEVRDWLRRSAVCVLSSDSEGMPVSLMEAAACGLPAVATAVGGVPEQILDGVTGFVVPPRNPAALADALATLLADARLRTRLGEAAHAEAQRRFSIGHQVDRMMDVWQRMLAQ